MSKGYLIIVFREISLTQADRLLQGVSWVSAKAKLKNRHFTGGYRDSKPFFLTLQSGSKFPMDKRSIKDAFAKNFLNSHPCLILTHF